MSSLKAHVQTTRDSTDFEDNNTMLNNIQYEEDGNLVNDVVRIQRGDEDNELFQELPTCTHPLTCEDLQSDETKCGFGSFQPDWLQILASKKSYVIVYGVIGMFNFAIASYFISSITTLEKRFKIPSRTSGLILSTWDIGGLSVTLLLTYLGSKGHKTRWVAAGILLGALSCFMRLVPHIIFGPGQDAIELTEEYEQMYGTLDNSTDTTKQTRDYLCRSKYLEEEDCSVGGSSPLPTIIFIASFFILGIGNSMYYTLGIAYMDDNVRKNKTPLMLAISQCIRMLGPTIGYMFGSYALTKYIDSSLHPTITSDDPRWIGAWWLAWGPLGVVFIILAIVLGFFPKKLPRTAHRMATTGENVHRNTAKSFADFKLAIVRLTKNKILLYNSFSVVFFAFGFIGYWIFMPKYMEAQFRQSASRASLITGSVGLVCTGLGLLTSGIVISKFKPPARYLAAWNVIVELLEAIGCIFYSFLRCGVDDLHGEMKPDQRWDLIAECNVDCDCGPRINYSPVCTSDGRTTFYSPCHAGCTTIDVINGTKMFGNCSCIGTDGQGWAMEGACPVDCTVNFTTFLVIQCLLRFLSSSGRAGNTMIQFRCVAPGDKSLSISFTEVLLCALGLIPGPIFYGMLLDSACMVWGYTCGERGNCWLYDSHKLSSLMNFCASAFLIIGTLLDVGVWYHVKNLQIYDNDIEIKVVKVRTRKSEKEPIVPENVS